MRAHRVSAAASLLMAGVLLAPGVARSGEYRSLSDLETHFRAQGLEPLPGQGSMGVEDGVVGVFPGAPRDDDEKPYVLITSSPPAGMASVGILVDGARNGLEYNGLPLPPLLASAGRHVIVAYWSDAEETGEDVIPLAEVAAYIDLSDLAGGPLPSVRIRAAASSPVWMRLIEQSNIPLGLDLEIMEAPDLKSTRSARYTSLEIPGLQLEADAPPEPGRASGGYVPASTLAGLIAAKVSRIGAPPAFQRVDLTAAAPTSRRPYTGTIPAYTADVEGLLLEGVLPGGPAEDAGLRSGDVIVELAGTATPDVYAYSDALDSLEIDVPVTVVFERDGERRETTLIPRARE